MAQAFNLTAQLNLRGPSNVKKIVADIRRELGTVNANVQFRLDPSATRNTSALNSALKGLNSTFGGTSTSATNAARAIRSFGSAINSVNIRNVPQQINNTVASINRLNRTAASSSSSLSSASTEMQEFGKQAYLAVRRFAAFTGVTSVIFGVTNAINAGIKAFIDYDRQFVKLQQVTGQSASGLKALADSITSLSTQFGVASSDITEVASTLAQAGLSAKDTEKALKALTLSSLAPSFDDMNQTVEGSIALMRQFGISAGDLEKALGAVNSVSAQFAVESSDIIAAIQRTGGVFASASKGVSEGTDALNEFIAVFTSVRATTRESAETIATGLRTIFTRIQRGSTINALKQFGVDLTDAEGKFVGAYKAVQLLSEGLSRIDPRDLRFSQIVEELGGFRQIGKVIPLIQQFATAQDALKVAQRGQGSLALDAAKAQESLANKITKVKEEFFALFREIGSSKGFQTLIRGALDLSSALIKIADSIKGVLPALTVLAAFKGASALTQFASGFINPGRTQKQALGGPIRKFARGGVVPGTGNGDTVPAMLEPGEFVIRKKAVETIGVKNLHGMNKYGDGGSTKGYRTRIKYAKGGPVSVEELKDINPNAVQPDYRNANDAKNKLGEKDETWSKYRSDGTIGKSIRKTAVKYMQPQDAVSGDVEYVPVPDPNRSEIEKYFGSIVLPKGTKFINPKDKRMSGAYEKYINDKIKTIGAKYSGEYDPLDFETGDAKFYSSEENIEKYASINKVLSKRLRHQNVYNRIKWDPSTPEKKELPPTKIYHPTDLSANNSLKQRVTDWLLLSPSQKTAQAIIQGNVFNLGGLIQKFAKGGKTQTAAKGILLPALQTFLGHDKDKTDWTFSAGDIFKVKGLPSILDQIEEHYTVASAKVIGAGGENVAFDIGKEILKISRTGFGAQNLAKDFGVKKTDRDKMGNYQLPSGVPGVTGYRKVKTFGKISAALQDKVQFRDTEKAWKDAELLQGKLAKEGMYWLDAGGPNMGYDKQGNPTVIDGLVFSRSFVDTKVGRSSREDIEVDGMMAEMKYDESLKRKRRKKNSGGLIQKFGIGGTVQERATAKGMSLQDFILEQVAAIGGPGKVKEILGIPKGIRTVDSILNASNLKAGKNIEVATQYLQKVLDKKGTSDAAEEARIQSLKKVAVAGLVPIGYDKNFEWDIGNNRKVYATAKGFSATYQRAIDQMQKESADMSARFAENLQYSNIFGGGRLVFDFDETLVSGVDILDKDGKPDIQKYSDRKIVRETLKKGKLTRLGMKLKALVDEDPNFIRQTRILTARPQSTADLLAESLQSLGLPYTKSDITGVGQGTGTTAQKKAQNLSTMEKLIDDNYDNFVEATKSGKQAFLYTEPRSRPELSEILGQGNVEGAIVEAALAELGAKLPPIDQLEQNRAVDFPFGLGRAAQFFGVDPDVPTEVKRTLDGSAFDRARKEFGRYFEENPDRYRLGGSVARFAGGGKVDYYSLEKNSGFSPREFNELVYFAKTNDFTLDEFQKYIKQSLAQKKSRSGLMMNPIDVLRAITPEAPRATDKQLSLAESLKGPVDAKYNPKYDNAIKRYATGGSAEDTVPALLTPGEFVINKKAAQKIGLSNLNKLNKADKIQGYNKGGAVGFARFADGGSVSSTMLSSLATALARIAPTQNLAPVLSRRPDEISSGTIQISDNVSNQLETFVAALKQAGQNAAALSDVLKRGGEISYKAATTALEADVKRLQITGASLEQITAAEQLLASTRAAGQRTLTKRQFLEAGLKESKGGFGGSQQQILAKASEIEGKILAQKEKQLALELRKTGLSAQEATDTAKERLATPEQRQIIKDQALTTATQRVTGVSRKELSDMEISGGDIQKYISESMRDRKTLAQMDKQLIAIKQQEAMNTKAYVAADAAGKKRLLSEAEAAAKEEISVRRKMINDLAAETGGPGVGARSLTDVRNSPIWNMLKRNFDPRNAVGFNRTSSAISLASGALAGQGNTIANMMYNTRTPEGKRSAAATGAGLESSMSMLSTGMMVAAQTVSIPVIGPYVAAITAIGTAALAAGDYLYDFTGSQKAAIEAVEKEMRAKEIGQATDNLDKAFKNLEANMANIDLQAAFNQAMERSVSLQARDSVSNIEAAQRDYALQNRSWTDIFTGNFKGTARMNPMEQQEIYRAEAAKFADMANKGYSQIQSQIERGASLKQISEDANLAGSMKAIALSDASGIDEFNREVTAQGAQNNEALQQQILSEIALRKIQNNEIVKAAIKSKELADAMDAANRAGKELALSFNKVFDTINQSINRISYESKQRQASTESSVNALRGEAAIQTLDFKELNILENPLAYKDDPKAFRGAVDSAANMIGGTQGEMLRGAARLQTELPDAMTSAIATNLRSNRGLDIDQSADLAIKTGTEQIRALGLSEDMTNTLINKLTADVDSKRAEIKQKGGLNPEQATEQFIESIRNTSNALGEIGGKAVETAAALIKQRQSVFNQFAQNLQDAGKAAKAAENYFKSASNIRYRGNMDLREAQTGVGESFAETKARFDQEIGDLTGGITDPTAIRQNIQSLEAQREAEQKSFEQASRSGNEDEAKKFATNLQRTNQAINNNREALDKLANSAELAQKALDEVKNIRGLQQGREDFVNKLLTSTPEEMDNLNKAMVRLQRNLSGGLNNPDNQRDARKAFNETLRRTGSVREAAKAGNTVLANQRKETLALMQDPGFRAMMTLDMKNQGMSDVDIDKRFRQQEATLMQQMAVESGLNRNPAVQQAIAAKMDPNADPAMKRAAEQFLQTVGLQAKATEEQGRLELANVQRLLTTATDDLNLSIRNLTDVINANMGLDKGGFAAAKNIANQNMVALDYGIQRPVMASKGALVDFTPKGSDTVPAMLTPGEFVVNAKSTAEHLPLLKAINEGNLSGYSRGGVVYLARGGKSPAVDDQTASGPGMNPNQYPRGSIPMTHVKTGVTSGTDVPNPPGGMDNIDSIRFDQDVDASVREYTQMENGGASAARQYRFLNRVISGRETVSDDEMHNKRPYDIRQNVMNNIARQETGLSAQDWNAAFPNNQVEIKQKPYETSTTENQARQQEAPPIKAANDQKPSAPEDMSNRRNPLKEIMKRQREQAESKTQSSTAQSSASTPPRTPYSTESDLPMPMSFRTFMYPQSASEIESRRLIELDALGKTAERPETRDNKYSSLTSAQYRSLMMVDPVDRSPEKQKDYLAAKGAKKGLSGASLDSFVKSEMNKQEEAFRKRYARIKEQGDSASERDQEFASKYEQKQWNRRQELVKKIQEEEKLGTASIASYRSTISELQGLETASSPVLIAGMDRKAGYMEAQEQAKAAKLAQQQAEEAKLKAEQQAAEAKRIAEQRAAEDARRIAEQRAAEERERAAQQAAAEQARKQQQMAEAQQKEQARLQAEAQKQAEQQRVAQAEEAKRKSLWINSDNLLVSGFGYALGLGQAAGELAYGGLNVAGGALISAGGRLYQGVGYLRGSESQQAEGAAFAQVGEQAAMQGAYTAVEFGQAVLGQGPIQKGEKNWISQGDDQRVQIARQGGDLLGVSADTIASAARVGQNTAYSASSLATMVASPGSAASGGSALMKAAGTAAKVEDVLSPIGLARGVGSAVRAGANIAGDTVGRGSRAVLNSRLGPAITNTSDLVTDTANAAADSLRYKMFGGLDPDARLAQRMDARRKARSGPVEAVKKPYGSEEVRRILKEMDDQEAAENAAWARFQYREQRRRERLLSRELTPEQKTLQAQVDARLSQNRPKPRISAEEFMRRQQMSRSQAKPRISAEEFMRRQAAASNQSPASGSQSAVLSQVKKAPSALETIQQRVKARQSATTERLSEYASSDEARRRLASSGVLDIKNVEIKSGLKARDAKMGSRSADATYSPSPSRGQGSIRFKSSDVKDAVIDHELAHALQNNTIGQMKKAKDGSGIPYENLLKAKLGDDISAFLTDPEGYAALVKSIDKNEFGSMYKASTIINEPIELFSSLVQASNSPNFRKNQKAVDMLKKLMTFHGFAKGGIVYANNGALVTAQQSGTDTVPAMLTPGEFVVNRQAAQQHMPILNAINSGYYNRGGIVQYLANGGVVSPPKYYQQGGSVAPSSGANSGVSNDIGKAINSAMAGLGNIVGQISQLKEVYTMVNETVSQLGSVGESFVNGLTNTSSNLVSASQTLTEVSIPSTVNFTGNIESKHVFNGAEAANNVLNTLGPTMAENTKNQMDSAFQKVNKGLGNLDAGLFGPDSSKIMGMA